MTWRESVGKILAATAAKVSIQEKGDEERNQEEEDDYGFINGNPWWWNKTVFNERVKLKYFYDVLRVTT